MDPRLVRTIVAAMMFSLAMRVIVAAQGNPEAAKLKNPVAATPELIDAGKKACAKCACAWRITNYADFLQF